MFITEDSGDSAVEACIPEHWRAHTQFFINNPRLGQLRSIDAAYAQVQTSWIFHCEDDWDFYREGFIEESQRLLEEDPQALQVWLRSFNHDLMVHSPYVFLGERKVSHGIPFYVLGSHKADWQGFFPLTRGYAVARITCCMHRIPGSPERKTCRACMPGQTATR